MIHKLTVFVGILLILPIFTQALDWGIEEKFVQKSGISWGIEKLITKQPIRYTASLELTQEETQLFLANIQKWPSETLNFIKQNGRIDEFKDIVAILKHQFKFINTDGENPYDLKIVFENSNKSHDISDEDYNFSDVGGYINLNKGKVAINPQYRNLFDSITLHELGHYFGLADQEKSYPSANVHPEYSSDRNLKAGSIMRSLEDIPQPHLTCDDADGFINLIDLYLAKQNDGKFSDRASKGWTSLCEGNSNLYHEARTINRNPQFKVPVKHFFYRVYHYVEGKRTLPDSWLTEDHVDVMSLFKFHNRDKIKINREESNLVEKIISYVDIPLCSLGKKAKKIVRSFNYIFDEENDTGTITVDCFVDQNHTETYTVVMKLDEKTSFSYFIYPEDENLNVPFDLLNYSFTIENNKITKIRTTGIFPDHKDLNQIIWSDNGGRWSYVANLHNERYVLLNSESNSSLLPGEKTIDRINAEALLNVHEEITKDIQNFYNNFYKRLLKQIQMFKNQQENINNNSREIEDNLLHRIYKKFKETL